MFHTVTSILKWVSIPVLLLASLFSGFARSYEFMANLVVCMAAIICVQRAVRMREYWWAAGFVAIVIVFSPLILALKIFLLLGLICAAAFVTLWSALRTQPLVAR